MKQVFSLLSALLLSSAALSGQPADRQPFNEGWRFRTVTELGGREAVANFNDYGWRTVDLPHDWGVEGFLVDRIMVPGAPRKLDWWGKAWYRKHMMISPEDLKGRVLLEVDGAMSHAVVWVNGVRMGASEDGCASFAVDMTDVLREGDNIVAISLDNSPRSVRCYPGGGIGRNVWLTRVPKAGIAHWGVAVETPDVTVLGPSETEEGATEAWAAAQVRLRMRNAGETVRARVRTQIFRDQDGLLSEPLASVETPVPELTDSTELVQHLTLGRVFLWSPSTPYRYKAVTTVSTPYGEDRHTTFFGVRTAEFREDGFCLNGEPMPVKGVLLPLDLGALGAVWVDNLWEERLLRLREAGCNAVSTGEDAPAPELLDLCDRMGMLFFGRPDGPMADRDRNHPSMAGEAPEGTFDTYGYAPVDSPVPGAALFNPAGFPTDRYWVLRGEWSPEQPFAQIVTGHPDRDGLTFPVHVHTSGDGGVLYVNGRSQGYQKKNPETGRISWNRAVWEPGEVEVAVFRGGRPWVREKAETVGEPVAVVWAEDIERKIAGADRDKPVILRIPVEVVDGEGRPVSDAAPELEFSLVGHGRILAADAGDPAADTPFTAQKIKAFQGKAAVYIYKKGDEKIILSVRTSGLKGLRLEL